MRQASDNTLDQAMLSAWQVELKATRDATLKQQCLQREPELLPRFAAHYQQLKTLRRQMRRSLQRQWKRSLAGVALLVALGQAPALAATINVGGTCTLVRAIVAANNDTATPGCKKGSGADTIVLPLRSTQTLTAVNNTQPYGATGLPTVRTPITIMGNGSTIRRAKSAPSFHIFSVAQTGNLTLQKTTVSGSRSRSGQGALYNYGGNLNVVSSTISGNTGCGINNQYYYNDRYRSGRVTISNSIISGNTSCGIATFYTDSLTVTNSTISHNQGAGLIPDTTSAQIIGSTISGNGGAGIDTGVYSYTRIINSTITGNSGSERRINTVLGSFGGGVYVGYGSNAFIANSTISGNTADAGGGLYANDSYQTINVTNSTITGNAAGRGGGILIGGYASNLTLSRTIVAGNLSLQGRELFADERAKITAGNFNLFGYGSSSGLQGFTPGITDIVPSQPLSGILNPRLANNGGPTQTHALVAGSPAIDAINDGTCPPPAKDQRGVKRPQDGNGDGGPACDIGSFELAVGVVAPLAPPTASVLKPPGPPASPGPPPPLVAGPPVTVSEPIPPVEPPPSVDQPPPLY